MGISDNRKQRYRWGNQSSPDLFMDSWCTTKTAFATMFNR